MITRAILCGMDSERDCLTRVFADSPQVKVYSGDDRLNLPKLVPSTVTLMMDMGLCGGIGPNVHVPDAVIAATLSHRKGIRTLHDTFQDALVEAARNIPLKPVPYFSSGLFNTSNTLAQRIAIYDSQPNHPEAMSDETRFGDAFTVQRGIEFQVCRVLSDSRFEDADLPPAATGQILRSNGSIDIAFLVESLALDPAQIPDLIELKNDLDKAMAVLEAMAQSIKSTILSY